MSRQRLREPLSCEIRGTAECCVDVSADMSTAAATNVEVPEASAKSRPSLDTVVDGNVQETPATYIFTVSRAKNGQDYGSDSGGCPSTEDADFLPQNRRVKKGPITQEGSDAGLSQGKTGEAESPDIGVGMINNDDPAQSPGTSQSTVAPSCRVSSFHHHCLPQSSCQLQEVEVPVTEQVNNRGVEPVYLQSYSFNQDNTCFVCATSVGFRVFTCAPLSEFMRRELPAWGEGCYEVAGMLFRTNVFALVSRADPKKVKLWDDQKRHFIGEVRARQAVKNICLGREILAVVTEYSGVLPRYFSAVRSFAQFHVPTDQQSIDVRTPGSRIVGPLCAFAGERSNHLYLLHPNGVFYEFRFDPNYGDECTLLTATTWFAPRADFQIQSRFESASLPSELEGGHEGDDWQIVM
ncbi:hypothetical protein NCLIV_041070 [Neospora caninum Liverpool]|uniref:WD domain, G-beta repeat-containing protein n=1 Tax=Neospora caninum (strain Liverpool) TaxID=572307 RepID=F0VBP8_NEOCL|nr:hypothetical protein NCLIV_041070 [Neospora caninum Liverpool]CBZ51032.1 hypothetical protein NCLIV_041070 [Neospora caninum Liverpool]|eukprot:XP_003881065.1 hypothetical protein NCLIV_041070 [Neospora caninum Liverpool]